jgi:hypothetical protein
MKKRLAPLWLLSLVLVIFNPLPHLGGQGVPSITNGTVTVGFNMPCGGTISDIHTASPQWASDSKAVRTWPTWSNALRLTPTKVEMSANSVAGYLMTVTRALSELNPVACSHNPSFAKRMLYSGRP